jgi:monovalent cation/hydrogen antiporter
VLLGEQIPALLGTSPTTGGDALSGAAWRPALYVVVIVIALATLRFAWVWSSLRMSQLRARHRGAPPVPASWRLVLATSLAGVRGAVTLAGVLTLPLTMNDGTPFPARDLAVLLAAGVIVLSLLLATVGLPRVLRGLEPASESLHDEVENSTRIAGAEAAIVAIEQAQLALGHAHPQLARRAAISRRIVEMYQQRIGRCAGGEADAALRGEDDDIERQVRLTGLRAERSEVMQAGRRDGIGHLALRALVRELDLQETRYGG